MVNEAFRLFFCNCIKGSPVLTAMPHFFFHLHHGKARVEDRSGVALPDAEAAWYHAYRNARDLITDAGRERRHWSQQIVEVVDERGGHVWTMPLSEIAELTT
ncbi:MAG TPA: hypothetical protein VEZ20_16365 [Allosphingosinicella sp.]|nr:hypothetical protein [Allosphingosinicella sp.]